MGDALLQIEGLGTSFRTLNGVVRAIDDLNLHVEAGSILGLVGESGCGKSVTALSIMRLIRNPPGRIDAGRIVFDGRNLLELPPSEMRRIRGNRISMIFQEPMTSLNPLLKIGEQIRETFRLHQAISNRDAWERSVEMLRQVGIPAPRRRMKDYPHQLSGGMRQRVMIAMALSCRPQLMIADEPTTALDVTIQAQILDLMLKLKEELGTAIILITHDLGVIAETSEFVAVMYAGKLMEYASVIDLFDDPLHPYTKGLLNSVPRPAQNGRRRELLETIPGVVPSLTQLPPGCKFNDRCPQASTRCRHEEPPLVELSPNRFSRCWLQVP